MLGSARSASHQLLPNLWLKPQASHTSANLTLTIRLTPSTKYGRSHIDYTPLICSAQAFVAQWIEHLTSDQRVGGSSPSERTIVYNGLIESGEPPQCWGHNKRSQHESGRPKNTQPGVCRAIPPLYICIRRLHYVCICGQVFGEEDKRYSPTKNKKFK